WREVTLGVASEKYVEVKAGISSGDHVALNPLALMSEEEKREKFGPPTPNKPAAAKTLGAEDRREEFVAPAKPAAKAKGRGGRGAANPLVQKLRTIPPEDRARLKDASPEERIEILKKAGFTDEELRQLGIVGSRGRPDGDTPRGSEP